MCRPILYQRIKQTNIELHKSPYSIFSMRYKGKSPVEIKKKDL